jgi:hypothetical protein
MTGSQYETSRKAQKVASIGFLILAAGALSPLVIGSIEDSKRSERVRMAYSRMNPLCEPARRSFVIQGPDGEKEYRRGDSVEISGRKMEVSGFIPRRVGSGTLVLRDQHGALMLDFGEQSDMGLRFLGWKCD